MRALLVPPPGANLIWFEEVDSTNALAIRLMDALTVSLEDERLADTVIVAGSQSAGQGRGANAWVSPRGGLYATWMGWLEVEALATLPLAVGVSLAESVEALLPSARVELKWPNDLLIEGGKLGGVLCQSRVSPDWAWAIAGFGLNLELAPEVPERRMFRPMALSSYGLQLPVREAAWAIVAGLLTRLRDRLGDPAGCCRAWAGRMVHRPGDVLQVRSHGQVVEGRFAGFGSQGQLELEVGGVRREFLAAELDEPEA